MGRRRNGPLLSTRDDDEKTATEERNEWDKKRKSAGIGTFPSPPWGGGAQPRRYWKNAYGILRMNYDVDPMSNYDVGTTSFST